MNATCTPGGTTIMTASLARFVHYFTPQVTMTDFENAEVVHTICSDAFSVWPGVVPRERKKLLQVPHAKTSVAICGLSAAPTGLGSTRSCHSAHIVALSSTSIPRRRKWYLRTRRHVTGLWHVSYDRRSERYAVKSCYTLRTPLYVVDISRCWLN